MRRVSWISSGAAQSATATTLLASSQADCDHFSGLGAQMVRLVPNGVDCDLYRQLPAGRSGSSPIILYVGTMSWEPNVKAAVFLAEHVLPLIRAEFPDCRLRIVGRDPTPQVQALGALAGVEVAGRVPEMVPHLAEAHALAVPLRSRRRNAAQDSRSVRRSSSGCQHADRMRRDRRKAGHAPRRRRPEPSASPRASARCAQRTVIRPPGDSSARPGVDRVRLGEPLVQLPVTQPPTRSNARASGALAPDTLARPVVRRSAGARPIRVLELRSATGAGGGPEKASSSAPPERTRAMSP